MIHGTLLKRFRQAVDAFELIQDGDAILVGVSGGKDSTTLLLALHTLSQMKHYAFRVMGFVVDHGMLGGLDDYLVYMRALGVDILVHDEPYAEQLSFSNDKTPCYTCSRLRKGILKTYALANGYNKIAYGHTKDDALETFFMNISKHGKLATIPPMLKEEVSGLSMIRPLLYVDEGMIERTVKQLDIPLMKDQCTFAKDRLRNQMEGLIRVIENESPGFSNQLMKAFHHVDVSRLML